MFADRHLKVPNVRSDSVELESLRERNLAHLADANVYRLLNYFGDAFEKIRISNVRKVTRKMLARAAIDGMMAALDSRSEYIEPKQFRDMEAQGQGKRPRIGGAGLEVTTDVGRFKVIHVREKESAARAGIKCGDIIVAINGAPLAGLTFRQFFHKLGGPVYSKMTLSILRIGRRRPFDVTITRQASYIKSVQFSAEGNVGYILIDQIHEKTVDKLASAFKALRKKIPIEKLKGYIIDLRRNTGGELKYIASVADAFLERGEILFTRGRDDNLSFVAKSGDLTKGKPIVILINGGTVAGAEILAGALQDHQRATIVGTRSFGSGTVQTIIPLGRGNGALRLTTSRLYTPSGRSIERDGVKPDFFVEQPTEAAANDGYASCTIPKSKSDDAQLQEALSLMRRNRP